MPYSNRPTSQAEYDAWLVGASVLFLVLGWTGLGIWFFARPENPDAAILLRNVSFVVMDMGLIVALGRWVIRRYVK